ncbi:MAG: hypothetical protein JRJ12_03630 [Deltaproteobacteria bacterium]|nr:hypothetical protein [Deltaproteobacteria bacterium]MBW2070240.1 hypothetical protein [Deltaproteobacteria bacterium]
MSKCAECGAAVAEDETYEHLGRILCEDCYLDALNPPRACDPWAVHTAKSSIRQGMQLTPTQQSILNMLKESGPLTAAELMRRLHLGENDFKTAFATLRHMELARAFKQGEQIYYTVFDSKSSKAGADAQ